MTDSTATVTDPIHPRREYALRVLDSQAARVEEQRANVATIPDAELPLTPKEQAVKVARLAASDGMTRVWEILRTDPGLTEHEQHAVRLEAAELLADAVREAGAKVTAQEAQRILSQPLASS